MSTELAAALSDAGGAGAPPSRLAQLRALLDAALRHGEHELELKRSGYEDPVVVAIAAGATHVRALLPLPSSFRADPDATSERGLHLAAAALATLVELAELPAPLHELDVEAGDQDGRLVLALPVGTPTSPQDLDELVLIAFEEHAARIDRLRARALAVPDALIHPDELRAPIGAGHPLRIAEAVARLGGRPADPSSVEEHEEAVLAMTGAGAREAARPHDDPDPALRVARRILQRLNGMGKWGGYHTDFSHLPRGFAGNERALAQEVGEQLLAAGLLAEKPSVGQRHVFLNPRRAAEIHALIERGQMPGGLELPRLRN